MIPDLQPNHLRPFNLEQTTVGGLRLTTEQGRLLGLRNDQTVRGVTDESGRQITLSSEQSSLQVALTARAPGLAQVMFRSWLGPRGFVLQPLPLAPKSTAPPDALAATVPNILSVLPARANYLLNLQTPLAILSAFSQHQLLRQWALPSAKPTKTPSEPSPTRSHITSATIESALINSGLLGQHRTASGVTLMTLLESARKRLEDTRSTQAGLEMQDISDAIDYLESAQLQGLLKQEAQEIFYRFPLLLHDAAPVEVCIQREKPTQHNGYSPNWCVDVDLPADEYCSGIQISIQLSQQSALILAIWTQEQELATLMQQELPLLARQLSTWDIAIDQCQIIHGQRPAKSLTITDANPFTGHRLDCYT